MTTQTPPSSRFLNDGDFLRERALEYVVDIGLSKITRFITDPFTPPQLRETTAEHVKRVRDENVARVNATVASPYKEVAAQTVSILADVHDADEVSWELITFKTETDPWFQAEIKARGFEGFTRRTAEFWLEAALITAADNEAALFEAFVDESHSFIPHVLYKRNATPEETIDTYQKLDVYFKDVNEKYLTPMRQSKDNLITSQSAFFMTHYDDVELKRTLLGACVKMDEKRLGTQKQAECEFQKLFTPHHNYPPLSKASSAYYFSQSNRYEPIIPQIVTMAQTQPDYARYAASIIDAVYDTQIYRAPLKALYHLKTPQDEPTHTDEEERHDAWTTQMREQYKKNQIGAAKPETILTQSDVIAEYSLAKQYLAKGAVMQPYKIKDGQKTPTNLLQRDGFDLIKLI